jgi:hypothetical protein
LLRTRRRALIGICSTTSFGWCWSSRSEDYSGAAMSTQCASMYHSATRPEPLFPPTMKLQAFTHAPPPRRIETRLNVCRFIWYSSTLCSFAHPSLPPARSSHTAGGIQSCMAVTWTLYSPSLCLSVSLDFANTLLDTPMKSPNSKRNALLCGPRM